MLGWRTIAVLAVASADAVTILGDFAGNPVGARKRPDDVAHQLRFSDAPGMTANNDQPPQDFFFGCISVCHSSYASRTAGLVATPLSSAFFFQFFNAFAQFRKTRKPGVRFLELV